MSGSCARRVTSLSGLPRRKPVKQTALKGKAQEAHGRTSVPLAGITNHREPAPAQTCSPRPTPRRTPRRCLDNRQAPSSRSAHPQCCSKPSNLLQRAKHSAFKKGQLSPRMGSVLIAREAKCAPLSSSSCASSWQLSSHLPVRPSNIGAMLKVSGLHGPNSHSCALTFIRRSIFISLTAGISNSSRKEQSTSRRSRKQAISWYAAFASNEPGPAPLLADGATTGADRMRLPASTCNRV